MQSILTPWEVKGKINYLAQIEQFGTSPVDTKLVERWERVTKMKAHAFIRRGIVFSHQDVDKILDDVEAGKQVYIYTGRGPSSESMHLGHMVPFLFTKYLQDALNCIVVIQMSDEEKYFFKEGSGVESLKHYNSLSYKNAKDIIACGFDVDKTFIFSDLEFNSGDLFFNNCLLMKATTMNQIQNIYGLGVALDQRVVNLCKKELEKEVDEDNKKAYEKIVSAYDSKESSNSVGQCVWPCFQCGPSYSTSFRGIFERSGVSGENINNIRCIVNMSIDQSPFFRLARDLAHITGCPKPAVIHGEFLPPLVGDGKMGSTGDNSDMTLFLDIDPDKVEGMIKKHAFSGGRATKEEHRQYGGDVAIDIAYQFLTFFLESDEELENIAKKYSSGELLSGELKAMTAKLVSNVIKEHQEKKSKITDELLKTYFDSNRILKIGGVIERDYIKTDFSRGAGLDFDRTFGLRK